jgi:thiamine biosynthesis lipoprotein
VVAFAVGKQTMSEPIIHVFKHHAMAAEFQVRIADAEKTYAAQTAQAAFALLDELESRLSRFRADSEISQIAQLAPGETLRLGEPVFACLEIAKKMELATRGAFSISAAALQSQPAQPKWTLLKEQFSIRCDSGRLEFDLGAIGKGFALDRMAEVLREWNCKSFLLVAGGSSILAGEPPPENSGWSCGLGDDNSPRRYWLKNGSLSGSGLAVKGKHIFDPRTGQAARRENRAWALAETAAESDALSTACMVLDEADVADILSNLSGAFVWLLDGHEWKEFRDRKLPGIKVDRSSG